MLTLGKIILFYPPYDGTPLRAPLELLSLAGTLREANFKVVLIIQTPIRWRLRSSLFSFPWELWLSKLSERLVKRRSLVTGQELPTESANAC